LQEKNFFLPKTFLIRSKQFFDFDKKQAKKLNYKVPIGACISKNINKNAINNLNTNIENILQTTGDKNIKTIDINTNDNSINNKDNNQNQKSTVFLTSINNNSPIKTNINNKYTNSIRKNKNMKSKKKHTFSKQQQWQ